MCCLIARSSWWACPDYLHCSFDPLLSASADIKIRPLSHTGQLSEHHASNVKPSPPNQVHIVSGIHYELAFCSIACGSGDNECKHTEECVVERTLSPWPLSRTNSRWDEKIQFKNYFICQIAVNAQLLGNCCQCSTAWKLLSIPNCL